MESGYNSYRSRGGQVGRKSGYRKPTETMMLQYTKEISLLKKGIASTPGDKLLLMTLGLLLVISGPSCFIAWTKLRKRNLGHKLKCPRECSIRRQAHKHCQISETQTRGPLQAEDSSLEDMASYSLHPPSHRLRSSLFLWRPGLYSSIPAASSALS